MPRPNTAAAIHTSTPMPGMIARTRRIPQPRKKAPNRDPRRPQDRAAEEERTGDVADGVDEAHRAEHTESERQAHEGAEREERHDGHADHDARGR